MTISIKLCAVVLALATVATTCTTVGGSRAHSGKVYLVGVAGGG
jgi:hypothetical protein